MMSLESVPRIALIAVIFCAAAVVAAPYQELVPKKGWVPVYIREGDTPLSEIHPKLAEAFHENESANLKLEDASKEEKVTLPSEANESMQEQTEEAKKVEETEVPATVVEEKLQESDIASFDVVNGDDKEDNADTHTEDKHEE